LNTIEYGDLIQKLDAQISELQRVEEEKARRDKLEQELKLVDHWLEGLGKRKSEIESRGAVPVVDIEVKLAELRIRAVEIRAALEGRAVVHEEDRNVFEWIANEAINGRANLDLSMREVWLNCEILACHWKVASERLTPQALNAESSARRAYALIREWMDVQPERGPFIQALHPSSRGMDWEARIAVCVAELQKEAARAGEERAQAEALEKTIEDLTYAVRSFPEGSVDERQLRHALRQAARYPHLREEAAEIAAPHHDLLKEEFAFLWTDPAAAKQEVEPSRTLSRREIVSRILRRMKSKALIGGCHGPVEVLKNGFPSHQRGEAGQVVDFLVKAGIVKLKSTKIGGRVSLFPDALGMVDLLVDGKSCGKALVDEWLSEAEQCSAK